MKRHVFQSLLLALVVSGVEARAQFYAPETEFHDKAQRLFVVEAARVLAWQENLRGKNISEVTFRVSTDTNHTTSWILNWLDSSSNVVKEIRVSYPEAALKKGPEFYRDAFKQICAQIKWSPPSTISSSNLNDGFWKGAELNGMAREAGLQASFKLVGKETAFPDAQHVPEIAGLLAMLPMPSLCGGFTLDADLLARGAVWLALSETMLGNPGDAADENWAPILFMAGRENAACALWKEKVKSESAGRSPHTLFQWWDFFLRRPTARAAFEFVADPRQQRFGMPMMTYYSRLEYLGGVLAEVARLIYGKDITTFSGLYGYGGFFQASTDVGGGRMLEGAWSAIFRARWIEALKNYPASPLDYTGYTNRLANISSFDPLSGVSEEDPSLTGLRQTAALLELGYKEGTGKLIPVAVVTARDLLNYGWEMNGSQMGARHHFVSRSWGVPDLAETIFRKATRDIEGQAPFFATGGQGQVFNLQETLYRLQMVDDLSWRVDVNIQPFAKDTGDPVGARMFLQRCWLRPYEVRWQAWALTKANLCDERQTMMEQYHAECGLKSDVLTLEYFRDMFVEKDFDSDPQLKQLKEQIAESMIEPTALQIKILDPKRYARLDNVERAEVYEKIFWQNPDCNLEQAILNNYITGGAWKSAKRFYKQARKIVNRDVGFSNSMAPQAWMVGFLTDDEELMSLAVEDSDSGSYVAMMTAVWHHAAHAEIEKTKEQLSELVERYESESGPRSQGRMLREFLPLIPALKDPKSSQHEKALDFFGKSENGVFLRWILIRKYNLSAEEAIRFLGGRETDRLRHVLIVYLEKNEPQRKQSFYDYIESGGNKGAGRALASWAAGQPEKMPAKYKQEDLKAPGAKSIRQAVLEKLRAQ